MEPTPLLLGSTVHCATSPPLRRATLLGMLRAIRIVTLSVSDLTEAECAYVDWLGYQRVERGLIENTLAQCWGTSLLEGSPYALLRSAGGPEVVLRLIERPITPGFAPLRTHGWNANEMLALDPVALERRLRKPDSPFEVIGASAPLDSNPKIIAMQAIGPNRELNYFTRIPPEGGTFVKCAARAFVDRSFIMVIGGSSMTALREFYGEHLAMPVTEPFLSKVSVLNDALELPADHRTALALVPLSSSFVLELDEYPSGTIPRPCREGDIPPGISMVSFTTGTLKDRLPWRTPPTAIDAQPYCGRRAGVIVGAAGEWIELIEESN